MMMTTTTITLEELFAIQVEAMQIGAQSAQERIAALEAEIARLQAQLVAGQAQPAPQPDPLVALIPPLDQWPARAMAWYADESGVYGWVEWIPVDNMWWMTAGNGHVTLPPGYDWRRSLRLRPAA